MLLYLLGFDILFCSFTLLKRVNPNPSILRMSRRRMGIINLC